MASPLALDGTNLTLDGFLEVVRGGRPVGITPGARARVEAARSAVDRAVAADRPIYGVNTGFGKLGDVRIPAHRAQELQLALVRSHASGAGPPLPAELVRGMMLLRLESLARGHSGVRPVVLERLVDYLNRGLVPWIPEQGSVGASGDLAPLAHLAETLVGEGAFVGAHGVREPAPERLHREQLAPLTLAEKEGVALINGTALMAAGLALAVADVRRLEEAAVIAAALSFDALVGDPTSLDDRLGQLRGSPEHREVAGELRALLDGSELATRHGAYRGQDPYTLRCLPQVFAAVRLGWGFAEGIATGELNAVTDNPVILGEDEFVSGGNFHGQPLALALDTLALPVHYLTAFAERRIARLVNPALNRGLPAFLAPDPGVSSGMMIPQYLAAALVNEGLTLVHPASPGSLSTSADQEDFVSMGPFAAGKLRTMIRNAWTVLAVEWIVAGQALELRRPRHGGRGSEAALGALRRIVAPWTQDRSPAPDIAAVAAALSDGSLIAAVRADVRF